MTLEQFEAAVYSDAFAYYLLRRKYLRMREAGNKPGNRTAEYHAFQNILEHAAEHLWTRIGDAAVTRGVSVRPILDLAYEDLGGVR